MAMTIFPREGWTQQKEAIEGELDRLRHALEAAATWEDTLRLQGEVRALRMLLAAAEPKHRPGVGSTRY